MNIIYIGIFSLSIIEVDKIFNHQQSSMKYIQYITFQNEMNFAAILSQNIDYISQPNIFEIDVSICLIP